jgi:hypothetical protein
MYAVYLTIPPKFSPMSPPIQPPFRDHPYKRPLTGGTVGVPGELSLNFGIRLRFRPSIPLPVQQPQDTTWCRMVRGTRMSSNTTGTHEVTPVSLVRHLDTRLPSSTLCVPNNTNKSSWLAELASNLRRITAPPILAVLPHCHHTSFPHNVLLQQQYAGAGSTEDLSSVSGLQTHITAMLKVVKAQS